VPLFTSGGLSLDLVSSGLGLGRGLKNMVLFTSLNTTQDGIIWQSKGRVQRRRRRTDDRQLVLAVEQNVLTAPFHRIDELEGEPAAADDGDVGQIAEPVAVRLQMTLVDARYGRADRAAIAGSHLRTTTKPRVVQQRNVCSKAAVKVKVHTLDIAPLRSESPPQKRSGMARVLRGSHSFTCTPTRLSAIGMSHTCLCLPSYNWYSFTDPGGMEGW